MNGRICPDFPMTTAKAAPHLGISATTLRNQLTAREGEWPPHVAWRTTGTPTGHWRVRPLSFLEYRKANTPVSESDPYGLTSIGTVSVEELLANYKRGNLPK